MARGILAQYHRWDFDWNLATFFIVTVGMKRVLPISVLLLLLLPFGIISPTEAPSNLVNGFLKKVLRSVAITITT